TLRTGCMVYKDGRLLVQDQDTQEVIEVSGTNLAANVGNRVAVRGSTSNVRAAVAPATSVMNVTSVAIVAQGGCLSVAATLEAKTEMPVAVPTPTVATANPPAPAPSPAPAAHTGMSTGANRGIVHSSGGRRACPAPAAAG